MIKHDPIELAEQFQSAQPFPHIVIDDLFSRDLVEQAATEVPPPSDHRWKHYRDKAQEMGGRPKLAISDASDAGPASEKIVAELVSSPFRKWLARLTGVPKLIADPELSGAGLHSTGRGGRLGVHVDFVQHKSNAYRRVNVFVYLNGDWQDEWGGHLELWDDQPDGQFKCVKRITPLLGRFVAFECSEHSWHGHPTPLLCPEDRRRNSIAAYYYSRQKPDWFVEQHSTIYRPEA